MKSHSLIKDLPRAEQQKLLEAYPPVRFQPGEILHQPGSPATRVWLVLEGSLHGIQPCLGSAPLVFCQGEAGGTFGACCAMDRGAYACQAVVETPAVLLSLPLGVFQELMNRYPKFGCALAVEMSKRLNACMEDQLALRGSVDQRLRAAVERLMQAHGRHLPVPRRELARMAHTSVEAAIRTVQRWRELGWVEARWKSIEIKRVAPFRRSPSKVFLGAPIRRRVSR